MSLAYSIAIALGLVGFMVIILLAFIGTLEVIDNKNKIARNERLSKSFERNQKLMEGKYDL
jgi:hypothetical protein